MSDDGVLTPAGFASPGRLELAKALRDLIHVAMTAEPRDDATLASITAAARVATSHLAAGTGEGDHGGRRRRIEHGHDDYKHRSLLLDQTNPIAPGWQWWRDGDAAVARGSFGAPYEGAEGLVHGGWIALALDELLGFLNVMHGIVALTGTLTVSYRAPTKIGAPLEVVARREQCKGRRVVNRATMTEAGVVTAEAEGIFIRLPQDQGASP